MKYWWNRCCWLRTSESTRETERETEFRMTFLSRFDVHAQFHVILKTFSLSTEFISRSNQTKRRFIAFYNITCWIVCLNFIWNWTFFPFFFRTNYMWHGFLFNLVNYTENKKHYVRSSQIFKQNEIGDFSTKKVDP